MNHPEQWCPICRRPVTQITADYRDGSPIQPRTYWPCGHAPVRQFVAKTRDDRADVYAHTVDCNCNTAHEGPDPCPVHSPDFGTSFVQAAQRLRESYRTRPGGWYILLPPWVVYKDGRTFEQFAAEFDESAKRIALFGAVGFEVAAQWNDEHVRRHRISWLDGGAPPPGQEETNINE